MPVDRASPGDLMHLAGQVHRAALQVGAILILSGHSTMDSAPVSGMLAAGVAIADRDACPDLSILAACLQDELDRLGELQAIQPPDGEGASPHTP